MREPKMLCLDCEWIGSQSDCKQGVEHTRDGDEETVMYCPKCESKNVVRLTDKGAKSLVSVGV